MHSALLALSCHDAKRLRAEQMPSSAQLSSQLSRHVERTVAATSVRQQSRTSSGHIVRRASHHLHRTCINSTVGRAEWRAIQQACIGSGRDAQ
jgi:hypothetical protein